MQLVVSAACRCCALKKSVRKHFGDGFAELTAPCLPKKDEPKCRSKGSHTQTHAPYLKCFLCKVRAAAVGCSPEAGDTRGPLAQGPGAVQSWAAAAVAAMMSLASSRSE